MVASAHERFLELKSCKGILFDMDGVLLDTEPLYTVAYNRVLAPFGASLDRDTKLEIMGRKAIESAAHVLTKFGIDLSPEEFLARRTPILQELFGAAPAMEGASELVARLKGFGCRVAVATSTARPIFEIKTKAHPWFSLFDQIVCGDDPEVGEPKPAPDIFLVAASRIGIDPSECSIFEDSPSGARAAVASGGRTFAYVPNPAEDGRFPIECTFVRSFAEVSSALT